jgi:hypothetical protein
MEEETLKRLMSSIKCGSCGDYFREDNVEVLGNSGEMWFLQIICPACDTQSLIVAIVQKCNQPGQEAEAPEREQVRIAAVRAVDGDDLLDMHRFLKEFDGDFRRLFGEAS